MGRTRAGRPARPASGYGADDVIRGTCSSATRWISGAWRAITRGSLLRLRAEMKLPGLAWLELAVGRDHDCMTTHSQRAIFQPRGLAGHAYWRSIAPFHGAVFGGMLRNITAAAERADRSPDKPAPGGP